MKKVLTIGGAMYDIFIEYKDIETFSHNDVSYIMLHAGRKIEVEAVANYCGGGATNSAISFVKAGCEVEAFFKIGTDVAGDFIVNTLEMHNVITTNVVKTKETSTGHSFIMPHPHGNRPILAYRGANETLQEIDIPQNAIKHADQLYITSLSGPASSVLLPIVMAANTYKKNVAVNPGTSQLSTNVESLRVALPYIDTLILNSHEAQLFMASLHDNFSLKTFFSYIHENGPSIIVVTNGAEGAYVSNGETIFFHPSVGGDVVSTVGAGDAFSSTFVAYLMHQHSIEDALRAGIINSAAVIAHVGAQTGLLSKEEIDQKIGELDKNLLQRENHCYLN